MASIRGFIETSYVDWDGKIAAVIFLPGCNFRCPFCHNPDLVLNPQNLQEIPWAQIRNFLGQSKEWIDGVVITGGEPTLHKDLPELCRKIKNLNYPIKLDTNGSNPEMLSLLIKELLIDYIAMDIKTKLDPQKYYKLIGLESPAFFKNIQRSISILLTSGIEYEFRTTIVPHLHELEDIKQLAEHLRTAPKYVLQAYKSARTIDPLYSELQPFNEQELNAFFYAAQRGNRNVKLRR